MVMLEHGLAIRLKSCFGSYLTAGEDRSSVSLQQPQTEVTPSPIPPNTVWFTSVNEYARMIGYQTFRLESCHRNKWLAYLDRPPRQVYLASTLGFLLGDSYTSFSIDDRNFRKSSAAVNLNCNFFPFRISVSEYNYLRATQGGDVFVSHETPDASDSELYWAIEIVKDPWTCTPLRSTAPSRSGESQYLKDKEQQNKNNPSGLVVFNNYGSYPEATAAAVPPFYSSGSYYTSGQNTNGSGNQKIGDVNVRNTCGKYSLKIQLKP